MKRKLIVCTSALALILGGVYANSKFTTTQAYYFSNGNCISVTLGTAHFTTTASGGVQASIRKRGTLDGSENLFADIVSSTQCGTTPIYFNP